MIVNNNIFTGEDYFKLHFQMLQLIMDVFGQGKYGLLMQKFLYVSSFLKPSLLVRLLCLYQTLPLMWIFHVNLEIPSDQQMPI